MKLFIKKYQLPFVCGMVFLCLHPLAQAMHGAGSASEEFQDLVDLTPEQEALQEINRLISNLEHDYRHLHSQQVLRCQPEVIAHTIKTLDNHLAHTRNAFQTLLHAFPAPGPSRSFNTRCIQLAALIKRILVHIDSAHDTLGSNLKISHNEFTRVCELRQALSSALRGTTADHTLIHECERAVVHAATSVEQLQQITPRKLHGFCDGLAALAQSAVQFVHEQKQEQLRRASSAELLEQLGPGAEEQEDTRAAFAALPSQTPRILNPSLDGLTPHIQRLHQFAAQDPHNITRSIQHARTTVVHAVQHTCSAVDHGLSCATQLLEKYKGKDLNTPAIRNGVAYVIAPPTGTTLVFRLTQRLPEFLLRAIMPEPVVRILKSRGVQPSDFSLMHPKLCHLFGITPACKEWAIHQAPVVLQKVTDFLTPEHVEHVKAHIDKASAIIPAIEQTVSRKLKDARTIITPQRVHHVQCAVGTVARIADQIQHSAQETRDQEEQQAAKLRALGAYDKQLQQELQILQQTQERQAHILVQQATGTTLPLTPAQTILLGSRTTGEGPVLSTRASIRPVFLRHAHSQDAL